MAVAMVAAMAVAVLAAVKVELYAAVAVVVGGSGGGCDGVGDTGERRLRAVPFETPQLM